MKLKICTGIGALLFLVTAGMLVSCQSDEQIEFNRYYSLGNYIYEGRCQNCHGAQGDGLRGLIPPLNDTAYLTANKSSLACIIKNGLKKKITVSNRIFDGEMSPSDLSAPEIAQVLTYVTNSFGNKTGTITGRQVESGLKNCK